MNTKLFLTMFLAITAAGVCLYWLIRQLRQTELAEAQLGTTPRGEIGFAAVMQTRAAEKSRRADEPP